MIKDIKKLIGKEVKVSLDNGVNLYGILDSYIVSETDKNKYSELYINFKGNIMGILNDRINKISENVI